MNLLRPFTGAGAIMFPVGRPPKGTCEFATEECLRYCYVLEDVEYDEEMAVPESAKRHIYSQFLNRSIEWICDEIEYELKGLQTPILHWFGSGDCLKEDMKRVCEIIDRIARNEHIVQMGFTRNVELWKKYRSIFALTIESKKEARRRVGLFSIPNYKEQISVMYATWYEVTGGWCGPTSCRDFKDRIMEHAINCKTCLRLKAGCFDRRVRKEKK